MEPQGYEIQGHTFKAKIEGTCAVCKGRIQIGMEIAKLKRGVRTTGTGANNYPVYIDRFYAHEKCTKPPEPKWCTVHGQSAYPEEEECPLCGIQLRRVR